MSFENIFKKVIQEISRELVHKNIHIKEVFIRYYAGLLTMDPNWGISKNVLHNRHKIQRFVKYVTQKLVHQFDPDIITLKMQLFFTINCKENEEIIKQLRMQLNSKILPLQTDITRVTNTSADSKRLKKFYKKLIYYMTLHSGMGNPTYENVYIEVQTALSSIITDQEMSEFLIRTKYDKKEKLLEYTELVAGIRLFNKHCGKGGEGLEDVPKMLRKAVDAMQQEIQKILLNVMQKVNVLTTILDLHFVPTEIKANIYELHLINLPQGLTMLDIDRIKNLLVMFRQYEIFVRRLLSRVMEIEERQQEISERLWKIYDMINVVVQFKIAVPAHEVFPLFRELAKTWYKIQDEALLLSKYNDILVSLSIYIKQTVYPEYERQDWVTEQLLGGHQPQTDAERMREISKNALIPSDDPAFKLITPDNINNMNAVDFEFLGFCPWKMVATDGALIPGNPNLGFVENNGKRYIFSNSIAMNTFNTDAKNYLNRALELFRRKPDMIHFLGVQNQLMAVKDIEQLIPPELKRTETFSVECQTIDHPVPTNIDPNYKWNVWDLKREALLLANLSHCKTSSTQTEECAGLSPAKTQTYNLKEQGVQTKRDHGTNVPKPGQYIFGLRGRLDDKQIQLDLTETVQHSC